MKKKGSERGNMPFAMIAVAILLIAGTYGAVCAYIGRTNDNIDNLNTELDVFDDTVEEIRAAVGRGMGEIIADISRSDGGSMMDRAETFSIRAEAWLRFQFPMGNGTVTTTLSGHDMAMKGESLKILSADADGTDASMPVYLKAEGTVDVRMTSSSGSASKTISVSADGTSALPLVITQASLFELAVGGERPLLAQLISYQLSALAQYRVLQGYGALSDGGGKGTDAIITEKDVLDAYKNALAAIELLCFRTTSGSTDLEHLTKVDLAEELISTGGYIELDLTSIFAMAVASQTDALAGKWADYLMFDKVLDDIDSLFDSAAKAGEAVYNALVSLYNFISGGDTPKIAASNYLKTIMAEHGYSVKDYGRLTSSGTFGFSIPGGIYTLYHNGTAYPITISGGDMTIASPDKDVLDWDGWNSFLNDYRKERNSVTSYIRSVLNLVCLQLSSSYSLGTVRVSVDKGDDVTFATTLSGALSATLSAQKGSIGSALEYTARNVEFTDPMYSTMYKKIEENKDVLFGVSSIRGCIEDAIRENIKKQIEAQYGGTLLDSSLLERMVDDQMSSAEVKGAIGRYESMVSERVAMFKGVLENVRDKGGVMKEVMALMVTKGLMEMDLFPLFESRLRTLVGEIADHLRINAFDILDLPGVSQFVVADPDGHTHSETISLTRTDDVLISIVPPTKNSENTHYTDVFGDDHAAAYSATFRIRLTSDISFTATSSSTMSAMLGLIDSMYSGTARIDSEFVIPVMSGWALTGVDYVASHTIWDDVSEYVKNVLIPALSILLEPLLKPLREFYRMVDAVLGMIGSALIELTSYAAKLVERLYGIISDALDEIRSMLSGIADMFGDKIEGIMNITIGSQTFGFRLYDFELKVTMNAKDIYFNHKTVLKIEASLPISDIDAKFVLDMKKDDKGGYSFAGSAGMSTDEWHINVTLDPFMKIKKHAVEINALIRNVGIDIVVPEVVQYEKVDFRLSEVFPVLSNIPLAPGTKGSIDAGIELKYNLPYQYGLVINEFESNPPGSDAGKEWVELYNSTKETIDLAGFVLIMNSADNKSHTITEGTIGPGEHHVVTIPRQMLNNSVGKKGNGECISLVDPEGNVVDKTPWKADTKDDNKTWQRKYDGALEWTFKEGTKGKSNGGAGLSGNPAVDIVKSCFISAATECIGKMGVITDLDGVSDLFKQIIETAIKNIIKQIASCIVEASVFFEIRVSDLLGAAGNGIRLSVVIGPDLIEDGLTWIVNELKTLIFNIDNPAGVELKTILAEDIHIRFTVFTGIRAPNFLGTLSNSGVNVSVLVQCNISAVCTLLGKDIGDWSVTVGVVMEDVPASAIPKMFKTDKSKHADIWLVRGTFHRAST